MGAAESTEDIMTVREASDYLRISIRKMRSLISEDEIPYARIGRLIRLKKSELDKWFKRHTVK